MPGIPDGICCCREPEPAITSSMRKMSSATSEADFTACVLIFSGSITPEAQESRALGVRG